MINFAELKSNTYAQGVTFVFFAGEHDSLLKLWVYFLFVIVLLFWRVLLARLNFNVVLILYLYSYSWALSAFSGVLRQTRSRTDTNYFLSRHVGRCAVVERALHRISCIVARGKSSLSPSFHRRGKYRFYNFQQFSQHSPDLDREWMQ